MFTHQNNFLKIALFSLVLGATNIYANNIVDMAISEYERAALSCDLNLYKNACNNLIDAAKNGDTNDAFFCWRTATDLAPKHSHAKRIAAYICAAGPWAVINTATHALSSRGDTTPCLATSTLSGGAAGSLSVIAFIYACATAAGIATRDDDMFTKGAIGTAVFSAVAALNWSSFYLNILASREKTAFDDVYKSLMRSLENTLHCKQTLIIVEKVSATPEVTIE